MTWPAAARSATRSWSISTPEELAAIIGDGAAALPVDIEARACR